MRRFSVQNQVISKKKGLRRSSEHFSVQKKVLAEIHPRIFSHSHPNFVWWGLFSFLYQKSASKLQKTCYFAYFSGQWGVKASFAPPSYATGLYMQLLFYYSTYLARNQDFAKGGRGFEPKVKIFCLKNAANERLAGQTGATKAYHIRVLEAEPPDAWRFS